MPNLVDIHYGYWNVKAAKDLGAYKYGYYVSNAIGASTMYIDEIRK
jgi:hypothetical protein